MPVAPDGSPNSDPNTNPNRDPDLDRSPNLITEPSLTTCLYFCHFECRRVGMSMSVYDPMGMSMSVYDPMRCKRV